MKICLAENVRAGRRERGLTQEQLAEALGVTVGAVSKWESGQSVPDVGLIMELADFLGTSVDALLGYAWQSGGGSGEAERLRRLTREKRYGEGSAEAEKALRKYPNCFDVIYESARLYNMMGLEEKDPKALERSLELYRTALDRLELNVREDVGELALRNRAAEVLLLLQKPEEALAQLKKNNFEGINDAAIGEALAQNHKPEEALPYLSDALWNGVSRLMQVTTGFANAYGDQGRYAEARELLLWLLSLLAGLREPGRVTFLGKSEAMYWAGAAQMDARLGREEPARRELQKARACAEEFDAAPEYGMAGLKFYHGKGTATAFDDLGKTAADGVLRLLAGDEETGAALRRLWDAPEEEKKHAD